MSRANEGTVVAVGPGSRNRDGDIVPIPIEVGAKVLLPEYGGHTVKLGEGDDNELSLFRADDILGVFEVRAGVLAKPRARAHLAVAVVHMPGSGLTHPRPCFACLLTAGVNTPSCVPPA